MRPHAPKRLFLLHLPVLLAVAFPLSVGAQCPTLQATIRDFLDTHPDFESVLGVDPGIVLPDLGLDGKPIYAGLAGNPTTHGQAAFDQWYRDVGGVNLPTTFNMPLTPTGPPGECGFSDSDFFPIDGQLFGNQGRSHNYHFTMETHATFTYNGGETFSFTGDDDLWLFLNKKLVVDLGGVHPPISGSVDLDAVAGAIGLQIGMTYPYDLFFAERHTVLSNFMMETSIVLDPVQTVQDTWGQLKAIYR